MQIEINYETNKINPNQKTDYFLFFLKTKLTVGVPPVGFIIIILSLYLYIKVVYFDFVMTFPSTSENLWLEMNWQKNHS